MKLELQINSKAINDTSRSLEGTGIVITPPIDEDFWLYRVPVSEKQAIVGFPKFGTIGVGFQVEDDWNTNLPSGTTAIEIYDHIKHNKGDKRIRREKCIEAIMMIQNAVLTMRRAELIETLKKTPNEQGRLDLICRFLRQNGDNYQIAEAVGR